MDNDCFKFIVSGKPLFHDLPQPGSTPIQALSMDDLKSPSVWLSYMTGSHPIDDWIESAVLQSMTKMQLEASNSNIVEGTTQSMNIWHHTNSLSDQCL